MPKKIRVYLAGQSNEHAGHWEESFKKIKYFDFHDWEFDSDQTSPDTYFPDDLNGVKQADVLIANPGVAPSEGTWIEIGYFYGLHTVQPGDFCDRLIIIWPKTRQPEWSVPFVKKAGLVVSSVDEAIQALEMVASKI